MNSVVYNSTKNRVYITQKVLLTADNVDPFIAECMSSINSAKPGFTIVIDMLAGTTGTPEAEVKLLDLRTYAVSKNPKGIATVVSSAMIKAMAKQRLKEVDLSIFPSLEEADAYLDKL